MTKEQIPEKTSEYLKAIQSYPVITPQEEIKLSQLIHGEDKKAAAQALEKLILSNLRLAIKISYEYKSFGCEIEDIIAEAQIGLHKAAQKFKPDKAKFSTYASLWIKQRIMKFLSNQSRTVRLPIHLLERINRIKRIINSIEQEIGELPSSEELELITGIKAENIDQLILRDQKVLSLDAPLDPNDGFQQGFKENLTDTDALTPELIAINESQKEQLHKALSMLTKREQAIITQRFGLNNNPPETLEMIGITQNVSRERIRQIQNTALKKLKNAYLKPPTKNAYNKTDIKKDIATMKKSKSNKAKK